MNDQNDPINRNVPLFRGRNLTLVCSHELIDGFITLNLTIRTKSGQISLQRSSGILEGPLINPYKCINQPGRKSFVVSFDRSRWAVAQYQLYWYRIVSPIIPLSLNSYFQESVLDINEEIRCPRRSVREITHIKVLVSIRARLTQ